MPIVHNIAGRREPGCSYTGSEQWIFSTYISLYLELTYDMEQELLHPLILTDKANIHVKAGVQITIIPVLFNPFQKDVS